MAFRIDLHIDLPGGEQAHVHGTIKDERSADLTPGEAAAAWLAPIDAGELGREVTGRSGWGSGDIFETALAVLREWASGRVAVH
jgi:hypothetical protein